MVYVPSVHLFLGMISLTVAAARYSFELVSGVWQQATFDLWRRRSKVPFTANVCLFALK